MIRVLKKHEWFHTDGFPIAVERRDPQEPFGLHAHEFSEMVIITGGHGLHVTGTDSWKLAEGDVFVIGGSRPHDYLNLQDLRLINILYQPDNLEMALHDLPSLPGYHALFRLEPEWRRHHQFKSRLHLAPKDLAFVTGLVDQLDVELRKRQTGFGFLATAAFMHIVGFLSRCYSVSAHPDHRALLRIGEAMAHLEARYHEPVNLDELARLAHMSKRSFLRAFHRATGTSPVAYLLQLRANRAAHLLRRSDQPITDIAFEVGFTDSNYFTRQFRKLMGVAPRAYRRLQAARA